MKQERFREWYQQMDQLTHLQKSRVCVKLQAEQQTNKVPERIEQRQSDLEETRCCVYCGAQGVARNGFHGGLIRFRCRAEGCGRTFNALTGSQLSRLRLKPKWTTFEACLRDRLTLQASASRCGVSYRTAFRWRHRFLAGIRDRTPLGGVVEVDETYFLESCKGERNLQERRIARKRGGQVARRGLGLEYRPALTAVARGGPTKARTLNSARAEPIWITLQEWLKEDGILVTDGHRSYVSANQHRNLQHEVLNRQRREFRRGIFHLNTVNHRHMAMKRALNHFHRGVSTRYLDHYMDWLSRLEFRPDAKQTPDFIEFNLSNLDTQLRT